MKVCELVPGMKFQIPIMESAIFIVHCPHPYYPSLELVIWRLADGEISLDALSNMQDVGEPIKQNPVEWREQLKQAIGIGEK